MVEDEAKWIDNQLFKFSFSKFKYISFKLSSSAARLAVMYSNKIINIKSWFETLYNIKLKDEVIFKEKKVQLEELLMTIK